MPGCFQEEAGLTAVSLFSGAGGLDVGFERAGFEVVFANEFDRDAAGAWMANRPGRAGVMAEGDILDHMGGLRAFEGGVDVVFGGPPCQGFSIAGKMDPDDPRSELVWAFMDAVGIVRPKAFLIENVAALGRMEKWRGVREKIASRAVELGYGISCRVHLATDFGVPERRERVMFVGVRADVGDAEAVAIQTFPPGYVFCGPASKRYRQIGNAVPCALAEAIAKAVRDAYLARPS